MSIEREALRCANDVWPRLARSAALDPRDYTVALLSVRRETGDQARVVAVADGPARYVIKFRLNGSADRFEAAVAAHQAAGAALAGIADCAAPAVLASDARAGALLLEWVRGPTLLQALQDNPERAPDALALAGRWMAALHGHGRTEAAAFSGDWMLGRLDRLAAQGVAEPEAFARCRAALAGIAQDARGTPMQRAVIHGDLTASNLIWDGHVMTGIDFENTGLHPVARDAATVLCDVAIRSDCAAQAGTATVLPRPIMDAFLQGLGADTAPAPVLRFFIGLKLLQHWTRLPDDPARWSARRVHMFARISAAASRLWPGAV